MGENVYNTNHGNFCIKKEKLKDLETALADYLSEKQSTTTDSLETSLGILDLECQYGDGDIIDIYLSSSWLSEWQWTALKEVVGEFVEPGSFLIFAFGGIDMVWSITFDEYEMEDGTRKVQGVEEDAYPIVPGDMRKLLNAMKQTDPETAALLQAKYCPHIFEGQGNG